MWLVDTLPGTELPRLRLRRDDARLGGTVGPQYRGLSLALGGEYARVRTDSALEGQGATSRLLAMFS